MELIAARLGNGLKERDVALASGWRVEHYLRAVDYDVKIFQHDGLQGICDAANDFNADLFVSIHCNAFDCNAHGTETYHFYGSTNGRKLANALHKQINTDMPAVLVETAFIDNPHDADLLRDRHSFAFV